MKNHAPSINYEKFGNIKRIECHWMYVNVYKEKSVHMHILELFMCRWITRNVILKALNRITDLLKLPCWNYEWY